MASVPPHVSYKSDPSELHTQPQSARTERGPRGRGPRDRVCVHVVSVRGDVQTIYGFSLPHFLQLYTVYSSATSTPHDRELWQTKAQSVMDSPPRARVSVRVPPHLVVRVASEKANKRLLGRSGVWALRARSKLPGAILKIAMLA